MKSAIEASFHKTWMKNIRSLKGVKNVIHLQKAPLSKKDPIKYSLQVTVNEGDKNKIINYNLNNRPSIETQDEYLFIYSDLKQKGYGG